MMNYLKYYIVLKDDIDGYKNIMIQSLGSQHIYIRMSLDDSKGIMVFSEDIAPQGLTPYTKEEMLVIVNGPEWTTISVTPSITPTISVTPTPSS
jgi:hypothetical protein